MSLDLLKQRSLISTGYDELARPKTISVPKMNGVTRILFGRMIPSVGKECLRSLKYFHSWDKRNLRNFAWEAKCRERGGRGTRHGLLAHAIDIAALNVNRFFSR